MNLDFDKVKELSREYDIPIYIIRDIAAAANDLNDVEEQCKERNHIYGLAQELFACRNSFLKVITERNFDLRNPANLWELCCLVYRCGVNATSSETLMGAAGAFLYLAEVFKVLENHRDSQ